MRNAENGVGGGNGGGSGAGSSGHILGRIRGADAPVLWALACERREAGLYYKYLGSRMV